MIVLVAALALIALLALIPIRIFAEYTSSVRVWVEVLFLRFNIFPKKKKAPEAPKSAASPAAGPNEPVREPSPPGKNEPLAEPVRPKKEVIKEKAKEKTDKPKPKKEPANKKAESAKEKTPAPETKAEETLLEKIARYLSLAEEFLGPLRKAVRRLIRAQSIKARVTVGTGDAAQTAVTAGMLWSVGYGLIGLTNRIFAVENHDLSIVPEYRGAAFEAEAACILRTNIANIICAAVILGFAFLRYKLRNKIKHGRKKK